MQAFRQKWSVMDGTVFGTTYHSTSQKAEALRDRVRSGEMSSYVALRVRPEGDVTEVNLTSEEAEILASYEARGEVYFIPEG